MGVLLHRKHASALCAWWVWLLKHFNVNFSLLEWSLWTTLLHQDWKEVTALLVLSVNMTVPLRTHLLLLSERCCVQQRIDECLKVTDDVFTAGCHTLYVTYGHAWPMISAILKSVVWLFSMTCEAKAKFVSHCHCSIRRIEGFGSHLRLQSGYLVICLLNWCSELDHLCFQYDEGSLPFTTSG